MPDYSLVPVDYQPDFGDYSLVPVDYDPFAADGVARQSQTQYAQAQPLGPLQQRPATGAGQPDAGAPAATPIDPLTSNGVLTPLRDENGMVDSYVYARRSTGTPPAGLQATTVNRNITATATDNAKPTNSGGVYGHTLTLSEAGSNNLLTITHADPTGLLVAIPVEGNPNLMSVREYKGY
jgi:hypothetical protein